ncbi:AraC family transcriptional regulator [Halobacteriales archaeon SW_8_65_20]|nr:MAG: AraC family transcriptional regulator [Halobacteriales archaeon SW_8_65_20]
MDIQILLYDGFDELDAIGSYEVLANGLQHADTDGTVRTVTCDEPGSVTASHGLRIESDGRLATPDLLVVPGGGWTEPGPGARAEYDDGRIPTRLAELPERTTVMTVCTGAMLAAKAGLFRERATTHAVARDDLAAAGVNVADARVVDDGVVSTAGVTAGLDGACYLVEREFGPAIRDEVLREMEYEARADVLVA